MIFPLFGGEAAAVLSAQPDEEVHQLIGHIYHGLKFLFCFIVLIQEIQLFHQLIFDCPRDEFKQRLGLDGHIHIAVPAGGLVVDGHAPHRVQGVLSDLDKRFGESLQSLIVQLRILEHGRGNGEGDPGRDEMALRKDIIDQKAMDAPVPVIEGVHENESKGHRRRVDDRMQTTVLHHLMSVQQSFHERGQVFRPGTDVMDDLPAMGNALSHIVLIGAVVAVAEALVHDLILDLDQLFLAAEIGLFRPFQQGDEFPGAGVVGLNMLDLKG